MEQKDLISVIVPIYNSEKFLKRCIDSILNQTYRNIEIVCINDGSQDNSLKILKDYSTVDDRIQIIDKPNCGVSAARNDGIKKSSGIYITFVDSDDWLEPNTIEVLYNSITQKNVDIVRYNFVVNETEDISLRTGTLYDLADKKIRDLKSEWFCQNIIRKILNGSIPAYSCLLFIRKSLLIENNIEFDTSLFFSEDTVFYFNFFNYAKSIYFLDKPLYHYYYSNPSNATNSNKLKNILQYPVIYEKLYEQLKKGKYDSEKILKDYCNKATMMFENYIFSLYIEKRSKKEIIEKVNIFIQNESFINIVSKVKDMDIPIHMRIPLDLILKQRYNRLFAFYKIRNFARKVKGNLDAK